MVSLSSKLTKSFQNNSNKEDFHLWKCIFLKKLQNNVCDYFLGTLLFFTLKLFWYIKKIKCNFIVPSTNSQPYHSTFAIFGHNLNNNNKIWNFKKITSHLVKSFKKINFKMSKFMDHHIPLSMNSLWSQPSHMNSNNKYSTSIPTLKSSQLTDSCC
jgi:hypothetical protein